MTTFLQDLLSRRLVAYVAGVKDGKTVTRWASGEVTGVLRESEQRLRTAYEIAQLLIRFDSPRIVRAWFIGLNPQPDDVSPAEAIHERRLKEAKAAGATALERRLSDLVNEARGLTPEAIDRSWASAPLQRLGF